MNLVSRCCHVMATGKTCQSPPLKDASYCYAHFRLCKRRHSVEAAARARERFLARQASEAKKRRDEFGFNFDFTAIDDRASFLVALGLVMQALAAGQISSRRAGHLLNGLQMLKGKLRD